jgi:hypothetical protein
LTAADDDGPMVPRAIERELLIGARDLKALARPAQPLLDQLVGHSAR